MAKLTAYTTSHMYIPCLMYMICHLSAKRVVFHCYRFVDLMTFVTFAIHC